MAWDNWNTRETEVGTGSYPDIADDLHNVIVKEVSEPKVEPNRYKAKDTDPDEVERFWIDWEITSGDHEGDTVRQWVSVPDGFRKGGALSDKSTLYKVMTALGFDMNSRFKVLPWEWEGMEARILTEQKRDENGNPADWARVIKNQPKRQTTKPKREPVAAGSRRNNSAPFGEEDEED